MGLHTGPSRRDVLGGITSPVFLLAYALAIPLLIFLIFMAGDVRRAIPAAESERRGLTDVSALQQVMVDAAREREAGACGTRAPGAAVERDIAAVDALQAREPFAPDRWRAATAAWHGGPAAGRASALIHGLIGTFRITSDQTGLTYDPEVRGIDIADALTYRLPGAFDAFRRAQATLCRPGDLSRAELTALEKDAGALHVLLADTSDDVEEASELGAPQAASLRSAQARVEASSAVALVALDRSVSAPSDPARAAATRATGVAADDIERLSARLEPSLHAIVEERLVGLHRRLVLTLLPSIVAIVAAVLVVVLGVRGQMQSAEMAKLREHQLELRYQATHDALTGLPNRAAFFAALEETIDGVWCDGGSVALLFIDLDHFKSINDTHGHAAGDDALRSASQRLRSICTEAGGRMTARLGGDEFAMLVADTNSGVLRERLAVVSRRIAMDLNRPLPIEHGREPSVSISASVGVAVQDGRNGPRRIASEMLREADAAMYQAKAKKRAGAYESSSRAAPASSPTA